MSQNLPDKNTGSGHEAATGKVITRSRQSVFYQGPLPPASEFGKYEEVLKGSADRILSMAENQSKHRQEIEKKVVKYDSIKSIGGLVSAFVIVLAGMGSGINLILNDKPTGGLVAIITPLGIVAGSFLMREYWKRNRKDQDDQ